MNVLHQEWWVFTSSMVMTTLLISLVKIGVIHRSGQDLRLFFWMGVTKDLQDKPKYFQMKGE
jgi:hypothetical protein